jgi:hypothetical protein
MERPGMSETWLPVVGFEGLYEVSDLGRVASLPSRTWPRRAILSAVPHVRGGYLFVTLRRDGGSHHRKIHHMVCEAFNGTRPSGTVTRHINGDHLDNAPGNLAWGTPSENMFDVVRHGRHHNAIKTACKNGHPLIGANLYVNATSGSRQCRICQAAAKAKYATKKASAR